VVIANDVDGAALSREFEMEHLIFLIVQWLVETKVTRSGSVLKKVRCENCTLDYEYEMHRTVKLHADAAKDELARRAELRLQRQLDEECDLVPCPYCGWYQRHMIERARQVATQAVPAWVIVGFLLGSLLACWTAGTIINPDDCAVFGACTGWLVGAGAAVCGLAVVLFIGHRVRRRFAYNPNATRWKSDESIP
jgi:hypothetical protein